MMHNHHIIPRHMNGTDEPSNIVSVTIEEHAELHLSLYLQYGHLADWLAYHTLSGQINISEASREAWLDGATRGGKTQGSRNVESGHLDKIRGNYTEQGKIKHSENGRRMISQAREVMFKKRLERRHSKIERIKHFRDKGMTYEQISTLVDMKPGIIGYYVREYL